MMSKSEISFEDLTPDDIDSAVKGLNDLRTSINKTVSDNVKENQESQKLRYAKRKGKTHE